jgi:RNA polymerase sigma factor (sigma-70 family)
MAKDDPEAFEEGFVHDEDLRRGADDDEAARAARLTQEHEERQWMAAWVAGDRGAGDRLVRAYVRPITRFFQAKLHDPEQVENLVSETFEQLIRAPKQVRTTVQAYIFGIARNTLFRHFRGKSRRKSNEEVMQSTLAALEEVESPFVINQRVETRLLLRAMRRIKFEQALALEMYYFEGCDGPAIAEILDVPEGTVRGYLRLGLVNLQRQILALERDPKVLTSSQSTYSWLGGLIRYIESLKARRQ